jgi:hypothetical protein
VRYEVNGTCPAISWQFKQSVCRIAETDFYKLPSMCKKKGLSHRISQACERLNKLQNNNKELNLLFPFAVFWK